MKINPATTLSENDQSAKEFEKLQKELVRLIQNPNWASIADLEASAEFTSQSITPETLHRVGVYRNGYFARVTQNLSQSLFSPLSEFLGSTFVESVLTRAFVESPATAPLLIKAADHLPNFVKTLPEYHDYPWLSDAFLFCILRWKVLESEDHQNSRNVHEQRTSGNEKSNNDLNPDFIYLLSSSAFLRS